MSSLSSKKKLSHYVVAWGPTAGEKTITFRTERAAKAAAKRYQADSDRWGERVTHKVFAVYVQEMRP
jgi:hypothetical protein